MDYYDLLLAKQLGGGGGGTGLTIDNFADGSVPDGDIELKTASTISSYAFYGRTKITSVVADVATKTNYQSFGYCTNMTSVSMPECTEIGSYSFENCTKLNSVNFPKAVTIRDHAFKETKALPSAYFPLVTVVYGAQTFMNSTATLVFPSMTSINSSNVLTTWKGTALDFGPNFATLGYMTFNGMNGATSPFNTLIIRNSTSVPTNVGGSNLSTSGEFRSGGAGGTIYIPKALYDHLNDGTSLDYMAQTNWASVINANANNHFAQIEGSVYETQYADGTLIPTGS